MRLYLIRHATAEESASSDARRELTKAGEEESRIVGQALGRLKIKPDMILASPLVRARRTAAIIGRELKFDGETTAIEELANESTSAQLLHALKRLSDKETLLLVGHMPSLADHLAALIGAHGANGLGFGKASVAYVEIDNLREGAGSLHWFMRQKQLALLVE